MSSILNPLHSNVVRNRQYSGSNSPTPRTIRVEPDEIHDSYSQGNSTHWASASVLAPISFGENSILHDIEKKEEQDETATGLQPRARAATRIRSGTVANELQLRGVGMRRASVDAIDRSVLFNDRATKFRQIFNFFESLVPRLQQRLNIYTSVFFIIIILSLADYYNDPKSWFGLYFALIAIDLATAIADQLVFQYLIDKVFLNHFEIAYLLHGFNGPLGMLIAIFIIGAGLKNFNATKAVPNWHMLVSAMTIVVLCICVKNWYSRRHYISVLEKRFSDKLFKLQSWTSLLSELATFLPKHARRDETTSVDGFSNQSQTSKTRSDAFIPGLEAFQRTVIDVFADLVEATSKYSDEFEEDVDVTRGRSPSVVSASGRPAGTQLPAVVKKTINSIWRSEIRKKRTFWELAARMSMNMGALLIYTYNGRVIIRRKFQAKSFGKSLYLHLSRGGRDVITHDTIKKIFEAQRNSSQKRDAVDGFDDDDDDESYGRRREREYHAISMLNKNADKDNMTLLYETAIELLDPFRLGYITEEQCMAALCLVYKEQRFAASSLNDYGELHHSLRTVIDTIFWAVMVVFLQSFLQWNLAQYYLPFVTMILTVSFALSSTLGNMFLAMVFVFFMSPFEIGNKIHIGADPNTRITGFVKSVSLFYTIINTSFNETMKIPNHSLFNEKICNLAESGGVVFSLDIHFPLSPEDASSQAKIDEFCDRLKTWMLVDNKLDWQACMVMATGINVKENVINFSVWATHRDNWQDSAKASLARTNLVRYMKWLQNEIGLGMVRVTENVKLVSESEDYLMHLTSHNLQQQQQQEQQRNASSPPPSPPPASSSTGLPPPPPPQSMLSPLKIYTSAPPHSLPLSSSSSKYATQIPFSGAAGIVPMQRGTSGNVTSSALALPSTATSRGQNQSDDANARSNSSIREEETKKK